MKKTLAALLFVLVFAGGGFAAGAPPFPFKAFPVPATDLAPVCDGLGLRGTINTEWMVIVGDEKNVFAHLTDGLPDFVYFTVDKDGAAIKVVRVLTIEEAKKQYPSPCDYFSPDVKT